jgi:hypothetical protein
MIRERTPVDVVEGVLDAIRSFPRRVKELAGKFEFREGPFPLIHTDLYKSNVIIDGEYNVLSVIDWEGAFVGPWELVEFNKELLVVPASMDGPLFKRNEQWIEMESAQAEYVKLVQRAEEKRGLDTQLSTVLADAPVQAFAHAFWLYDDGRIGFYDRVLEELLESRKGGKTIT